MPKAVYHGIYDNIKQSIENGVIAYQELLLSENELSKQYSCSRSAVRRALSELTKDGYIQAQQGKGARVIWQPKFDNDAETELESFSEMAERLGGEAENRVLVFERLICDRRIAELTGFKMGEHLTHVKRLRIVGPVARTLDDTYPRDAVVPGITREDAAKSTYDYIENTLGLTIAVSKRVITVELATKEDIRLLDIPDYRCVMVARGRSFTNKGIQFEFTESRQNPETAVHREVAIRKHRSPTESKHVMPEEVREANRRVAQAAKQHVGRSA